MSVSDLEARAKAVELLSAAWAEAEISGVPTDVIASVALAKALSELSNHLGEETAANIAARFADEIRAGKFSGGHNH